MRFIGSLNELDICLLDEGVVLGELDLIYLLTRRNPSARR